MRNGLWDLDVDAASATDVLFSIDESGLNGWHEISAGGLTELSLALTGSGPPAVAGSGTSTGSASTSVSPLPDREGFDRYTVEPGDTLARIADRFDLVLGQLVAENPHLRNPNQIWVGDPLFLPAGTLVVAADSTTAADTSAATGTPGDAATAPATTTDASVSPSGDAGVTPFNLALQPRDDDTWSWIAIGASIAAIVLGLGGLLLVRWRGRQTRRANPPRSVPAERAPDMGAPLMYRTFLRDRSLAGVSDTAPLQTDGLTRPDPFAGGH